VIEHLADNLTDHMQRAAKRRHALAFRHKS
jgi:hypothetical protein